MTATVPNAATPVHTNMSASREGSCHGATQAPDSMSLGGQSAFKTLSASTATTGTPPQTATADTGTMTQRIAGGMVEQRTRDVRGRLSTLLRFRHLCRVG